MTCDLDWSLGGDLAELRRQVGRMHFSDAAWGVLQTFLDLHQGDRGRREPVVMTLTGIACNRWTTTVYYTANEPDGRPGNYALVFRGGKLVPGSVALGLTEDDRIPLLVIYRPGATHLALAERVPDGLSELTGLDGEKHKLRELLTPGWRLELPRGFPKGDQSAERVAIERLQAEFGLKPTKQTYIQILGRYEPGAEFAALTTDLVYVSRLQRNQAAGLSSQGIGARLLVTPQQLEDLVGAGLILDGNSTSAILHAFLNGLL